jgi:DNA-binding Lrp family transcriptional regulator
MLTAFVLINTRRTHIQSAAQDLLEIEGVAEVYSVAGQCDLVAVVRVRENEQLASLVTEKLTAVEGITDTTTMIAFRQYSKHDLENMFGLGAV